MSVQVSVVVPTCRRDELLARCLGALLAQEFPAAAYEVIVVDDAPSCATEKLVGQCSSAAGAQGKTVRYIAQRGAHGPAAARNAGWRAARGAIIAFTDDDCLPDRCWLAAGMCAMAGGAAGAQGRIAVPLPAVPTDYERNAAGLSSAQFVTANCFYRRDVLAAVGGFDERFTAPWREDSDLYFALLERRAILVEALEAIVVHPVRRARWGVSMRQQRKSMFNALLYKKHPALYRQRIQAAPPWRYYRIVTALLAIVAGLATSRSGNAGRMPALPGQSIADWNSRVSRAVALVAAGGWVLLTARFALQRLRGTSHRPRDVVEMAMTSAVIPPLAVFWRLRGAVKFRVWFL